MAEQSVRVAAGDVLDALVIEAQHITAVAYDSVAEEVVLIVQTHEDAEPVPPRVRRHYRYDAYGYIEPHRTEVLD